MTSKSRGGVATDQQMGLSDEAQSAEVGALMKDWHDLALKGPDARAVIKQIEAAKDRALGALPGDDGAKHRYTWIDEDGDEPVQYIVLTTPPTDSKDVSFTREPKRRAVVEKQEAPRG